MSLERFQGTESYFGGVAPITVNSLIAKRNLKNLLHQRSYWSQSNEAQLTRFHSAEYKVRTPVAVKYCRIVFLRRIMNGSSGLIDGRGSPRGMGG